MTGGTGVPARVSLDGRDARRSIKQASLLASRLVFLQELPLLLV